MTNWLMFIDYQYEENTSVQFLPWDCLQTEAYEAHYEQNRRILRCKEWRYAWEQRINTLRAKLKGNLKDTRVVTPRNKVLGELVARFMKEPNRQDLLGEIMRLTYRNKRFMVLRARDALAIFIDKLDSGDWREPPWADEPWYRNHPLAWAHAAHYSVKNPELVAYQESVDKTLRNIQSVVSPGKYLTKFFSHALTDKEIKLWAETFLAKKQPYKLVILNNDTFEGTEYELQRRWVELYKYIEVDYSCMRGKSAVGVYGVKGNHLGLAYLEDEEGNYVTRSIVRFDEMKFVRAYPYTEGGHNLTVEKVEALLKSAGFTEGNLEGIRIDAERCSHGYVMPYLDGGMNVDFEGDRFKISRNGEYDCETTDGYIDVGMECDGCGCRVDEDDMRCDDDHSYCEDCYSERYVFAWGRREQSDYLREDCVEYEGEMYVKEYLAFHMLFICGSCDEVHLTEDGRETPDGELCTDCCVEVDVEHAGFDFIAKEDAITLDDGRVVHKHDEFLVPPIGRLIDRTPRNLNLELGLC